MWCKCLINNVAFPPILLHGVSVLTHIKKFIKTAESRDNKYHWLGLTRFAKQFVRLIETGVISSVLVTRMSSHHRVTEVVS